MTGSYVDDNMDIGNKHFQVELEIILSRFESKPRTFDDFTFVETKIFKMKPDKYMIKQTHFIFAL